MTYEQVTARLTEIEEALATLDVETDHPAHVYFIAKRNYEQAQAESYLLTQGTVDERKAETLLALVRSGEYKTWAHAEASYEAWRARNRVLETRASIGQSLLRALTREAPQGGPQPTWSRGDPMARRGVAA